MDPVARSQQSYTVLYIQLEKEKNSLEESVYKALKAQIKTLNTNKTRTNILKIFDIDRRGGAIRDVLEYRLYTLETGELLLRCPSAIDGP